MWWLAAAVGLGIPLVITAMPEFAMFSVGAAGRSSGRGTGGTIVVQVVAFAVVSVALLVFVRPIAYRSLQRPEHRSGVDALRGKQAVVLERVDGGAGGRIKLGGEIWSARARSRTGSSTRGSRWTWWRSTERPQS